MRVNDVVIDPLTTNVLYAATSFGDGGVFKSTNGGATWNPMISGLTDTDVFDLAIDPVDTSVLYASTNGGNFKTTDGAAGWTSWNTAGRPITIDPVDPQTIYFGSIPVSKSTDGGSTTTPLGDGLPFGLADALVLDPSDRFTVYAALSSGGVWGLNQGACIFTDGFESGDTSAW